LRAVNRLLGEPFDRASTDGGHYSHVCPYLPFPERGALVATTTRKQLTLVAAITLAVTAYLARERRQVTRELRESAGAAEAKPLRSFGNSNQAVRLSDPAINPILEHRIESVFPAIYMTVLAIIQGVGLGILLAKAQQQWTGHAAALYHVMIGTQTIAVFVAIIVVTHRYMLTVMMVSRMPSGFDILIPYILGVGEIGAAQLIGYNVAWWGGVLVFAVAAVTAYLHSRSRTTIMTYNGNSYLYRQFKRITRRALIILSLLALASIAMITLGALGKGSARLYALSPLIFVSATILIEIFGHYRVQSSDGSK
jgi:hypothetical protein